ATAHAFLKRIELKREDAPQVWALNRELLDLLEDVEKTAAALGLPEPLAPIDLPKQYLVPRRRFASEMDELAAKLTDLDAAIEALSQERGDPEKYALQNELVQFVAAKAARKSGAVRILSLDGLLDLRGIAQTASGIASLALSFWSTISAQAA